MLLEHECITKQALFLLYNLLNIYLKKLLNVYKFIKKNSHGFLLVNCFPIAMFLLLYRTLKHDMPSIYLLKVFILKV